MLTHRDIPNKLAVFQSRIVLGAPTDEAVEHVAQLAELPDAPDPSHTVFVGYASSLRLLMRNADTDLVQRQASRSTLVLAADEEPPRLPTGSCTVLIDMTDDLVSVCDELARCIGQARSAASPDPVTVEERHLLSVLLHESSPAALAQAAAEAVGNPVLVTDSSYNIVAHSVHEHMTDRVWATGWQRGYLTFEFIAQIKGREHARFEYDDARSSVVISGISEHRRRVQKLVFQHSLVGYLVILEYGRPLAETPERTYRLTAEAFAKQMSAGALAATHTYMKRELNLLTDLIEGRVLNRAMLRELASGTALQDPSTFHVLALDMRYERLDEQTVQDQLRNSIREAFPRSYSLFRDESVVIVLQAARRHEADDSDDLEDRARAFLRQRKLAGGIVGPFDDLLDLGLRCQQAQEAVHFGRLLNDESPLFPYDRYRHLHMVSLVPREHLEAIAHPGVLALARDDRARGGNLFDTLNTYLRTGCSVAQTAKRCFVHRNTVVYRLDKIARDYRLKLDDERELMSCAASCMIAQYLRLEGAL